VGVARQIQLKKDTDKAAARKLECENNIDETHVSVNKNQEEYDKQLLTLSTGFLAIILGFIKSVVVWDQAHPRGLLYSACCFSAPPSF
jgi:hypothetical protein